MKRKGKETKTRDGMSTGKVLATGGLVVIGGITAYGIYKIFEWQHEQEVIKYELIREYIREAEGLKEFLAGCIERGAITDTEREWIKAAQAEMDDKQINIESYNSNWLVDLVDELGEWGKKWGMYLIWPTVALAGVSIIGYVIWKLLKKYPLSKQVRPPETGPGPMPPPPDTPPPPFVCPIEGCMATFATQSALATHIQQYHPISTNLTALRNAQAVFNSTSVFAQDLVAIESGLYGRAYFDWGTIGAVSLIAIIIAIGVVLSVGTATPGVITAAYSVVAQAEAVKLAYQVSSVLVAVAA